MLCPACQHQNPAGARFCNACGAQLEPVCPSCASHNPAGSRFCNACGESLAEPVAPKTERSTGTVQVPDGERRQLTVMFCDLVGSTALSERLDAEELREIVRSYQEACAGAIARYEGYVAQYLGDGLLVYFGYPQAHEDDAMRALNAALAIQSDLPGLNARLAERLPTLREHPLQARIGVHTGPVVVGEIGAGVRREALALGDTLNLAARLEAVAEPGWVVISAATRRLVRGGFVFEDLGPKSMKGFAAPVPVFRVVRATGVHSRLELADVQGLTPLVGREQELGLLLERWEQVSEGHGQGLLIEGRQGSASPAWCRRCANGWPRHGTAGSSAVARPITRTAPSIRWSSWWTARSTSRVHGPRTPSWGVWSGPSRTPASTPPRRFRCSRRCSPFPFRTATRRSR